VHAWVARVNRHGQFTPRHMPSRMRRRGWRRRGKVNTLHLNPEALTPRTPHTPATKAQTTHCTEEEQKRSSYFFKHIRAAARSRSKISTYCCDVLHPSKISPMLTRDDAIRCTRTHVFSRGISVGRLVLVRYLCQKERVT
jgi:hypothetical protein